MMVELYKKYISIRKKPLNLREEDHHIFSHEFSKEIRSSHIVELEDVYVLKDTIFSLKKMKFYETYAQVRKRRIDKYLRHLYLFLTRPQSFERAIWIIDDCSSNYFHWFTDALPRLVAAEHLLTKDHVLLLPDHYRKLSFIKDSLRYFNITTAYYNPSKNVKVGKLLLPSHTSDMGNYNNELINKVRDRFRIRGSRNPERKIFISRKKAGRRQIVNEDLVQDALITSGFEVHYFEDYTFQQQVEIMSGARLVVALHGAGITNIIFMEKKGRMLELRNDNDSHNNCYFSLASEMEIDYYYQLNKGDSDKTITVNVTVDLDELKKNVALLVS